MVHAALREIIGPHVRQSGSLVAPDRLRFDFTHMSPLTKSEIRAVQDRVNEKIRSNADVQIHHTTYSKAIEDGALAFFGDTYDNEVRTVRIDHPWSFELCGGTHMDHTGGIGAFMITSESGIGAGVRRMEALTGIGAEQAISEFSDVLDSLSASLSTPTDQLVSRTQTLLDEVDTYRQRVAALEDEVLAASLGGGSSDPSGQQFTVKCGEEDVPVEVRRIPASNSAALRRASDSMRTQMGTGIAVLGAEFDGRPLIMVMVTKDLVENWVARRSDRAPVGADHGRRRRRRPPPGPGGRTRSLKTRCCVRSGTRRDRGSGELGGRTDIDSLCGRVLAVDLGDARMGLAVSDPSGTVVTPIEALVRVGGPDDVSAIATAAKEWDVSAIVIGLPLSMDGRRGEQARKALEFCNQLKRVTSAPVSTWDERLSTVEAAARLRDAGVRASRNRGRLDSASAAVILEAYLSSRRR